jgi:hypothetical protein
MIKIQHKRYSRIVVALVMFFALLTSLFPISFVDAQTSNTNVTVDLANNNAADTVMFGNSNSMAGSSIAVGDLNGDQVDDLIVGIPSNDGPGDRSRAGEVRVFFGGANLKGNFDLASMRGDVQIFGATAFDLLGSNVGLFDVNSDNIRDLVISAPGADGINDARDNAGEVLAIFGGPSFRAGLVDLAVTRPGLIAIGPNIGSQIGSSLAGADLNGDGNQDLIIGAPSAGQQSAGFVLALRGISITIGTTQVVDLGGSQDLVFSVTVSTPNARLGTNVAAGDVNGDGRQDLVFSAPGLTNAAGIPTGGVLVLNGPIMLQRPSSPITPNFISMGPANASRFGEGLAVGDIDLDQVDDLIVSAPGQAANGRANSGQTYVFYGGATLSGNKDLSNSPADASFSGANPGDQLGSALSINPGTTTPALSVSPILLADINRDGMRDLIIGAPNSTNPAGRPRNGQALIFLKGGNRFEQRDIQTKPADVTILGSRAGDQIANRFAVGDINNDTKPDLVIAAPASSGPQSRTNGGAIFVVSNFNLNAQGNNQPPVLSAVANQTVPETATVMVDFSALDPDGAITFSLDRPPTPSFVTLQDLGGGKGRLIISPPAGSRGSYTIALRATDNGNPPLFDAKSFSLTVTPPAPLITAVAFDGKNLTINGSRFGTGAKVRINNVDQSAKIKSSSDISISLKGKAKKLGLVTGANMIVVTDSSGNVSQPFILNL